MYYSFDMIKSEQDFVNSINSSIDDIKNTVIASAEYCVLIAGAMVGFDKGITNFLNKLNNNNPDIRFFLLSEVGWEFIELTKQKINFESKCTPFILGKECYIPNLEITTTSEMEHLFKTHKYLKNAYQNMSARYKNMYMKESYCKAVCFYAYLFFNVLLDTLKPDKVILWNKFYSIHTIFDGICKDRNITIEYMEFGCIPGTFSIELNGQQGESCIATNSYKFRKSKIDKSDLIFAKNVINYIKTTEMNRNVQPNDISIEYIKLSKKPIITYFGQNDFESGIYPYTKYSKKYHSPIFSTSDKAMLYLSRLAKKNDWQLIYKPHPLIIDMKKDIQCPDNVIIIEKCDVNDLIEKSDVIITIFSQISYISLIHNKPVVMLGYNQLKNKGCTYQAFKKYKIEMQINKALSNGYIYKQKNNFEINVAQMLKYYLYDDMTERDLRFGKSILV